VRRALAPFFTALAWAIWVLLWLPVLAAISDRFAAALPWASPTGYRSLEALRQLFEAFPLAVGAAAAVLALNGAMTWLYRYVRNPKHRADVDTHELADALALPEDKLAAWQAARIVRAEHSAQGRLVDAQILR
jgi:poly-beta-1,6-N-acetyl-D-glucosamine biosynthesis protein PgaD